MNDEKKITKHSSDYWEQHSLSWESGAYPDDSRLARKARGLDRWSHWLRGNSVLQRMHVALDLLGNNINGKKFNDVGCASGRFALELATRGALSVVGADISPHAIAEAEVRKAQVEAGNRVTFLCMNVIDPTVRLPDCDVGTALGVAEYVPPSFLPALVSGMHCRYFLIHVPQQPRSFSLRGFLRKIYLGLKSGPVVYFHDVAIFEKIALDLGLPPVRKLESDSEFVTNLP